MYHGWISLPHQVHLPITILSHCIVYAKQKHLGCKKLQGQEEAAL